MSTIIVYIESAADTPLTGASPTYSYWDVSSPGSPMATAQAMTELVGAGGGVYFATIATVDGKEYAGKIDATAGAAPGTRYRTFAMSGTQDARIETDIPLILADSHTAAEVVDDLLDETALDHEDSGSVGELFNWLRRARFNKLIQSSGSPGTLELYNDAGNAVIATFNITDEAGGTVDATSGVPARNSGITWPPA